MNTTRKILFLIVIDKLASKVSCGDLTEVLGLHLPWLLELGTITFAPRNVD